VLIATVKASMGPVCKVKVDPTLMVAMNWLIIRSIKMRMARLENVFVIAAMKSLGPLTVLTLIP